MVTSSSAVASTLSAKTSSPQPHRKIGCGSNSSGRTNSQYNNNHKDEDASDDGIDGKALGKFSTEEEHDGGNDSDNRPSKSSGRSEAGFLHPHCTNGERRHNNNDEETDQIAASLTSNSNTSTTNPTLFFTTADAAVNAADEEEAPNILANDGVAEEYSTYFYYCAEEQSEEEADLIRREEEALEELLNAITGEQDGADEADAEFLSSERGGGDSNGETASNRGSWKRLSQRAIADRIEVDSVDAFLLKRCRDEVTEIATRIWSRIYGPTEKFNPANFASISEADFAKLWLDIPIVNQLQQFVNRYLQIKATPEELISFVKVELWLSIYNVSPTHYFSPENRGAYPSAMHGMSKPRYFEILKALGSGMAKDNPTSEDMWAAPIRHDRLLADAMATMRKQCAKLGFVQRISILSLDDDLMRMRSITSIEETGSSQTNNPKKGVGVVHHGVVSLCTGLYLGGHVPSRAESTLTSVAMLQMSLCGAEKAGTESTMEVPNIFAWDRGYGGTSGEISSRTIAAGGEVLGTSKRIQSFPFTFGQKPTGKQKLIEEEGSQAAYWCEREVEGLNGAAKKHYALGYRSGMGKAVLFQTTLGEIAGPGKWCYVPSVKSYAYTLPEDPLLLDFETRKVQLITATQRTPDWFLMQKFRITGSIADRVWSVLGAGSRTVSHGHSGDATLNLPDEVKRVLDALKICHDVRLSTEEEAAADRVYNQAELDRLEVVDLNALCSTRGLSTGGTKANLTQRILAKQEETGNINVQQHIAKLTLSSWFSKPLSRNSQEGTKIGTLNEPFVINTLRPFISKHCKGSLSVCSIKEYGLLAKRDEPVAAFSPDGIVVMNSTDNRFLAGLEIKTETREQTTEEAETDLASKYGQFATVHVEDAELFAKLVPNRSYRAQIVHALACSGLSHWLYVGASTRAILRVVNIKMSLDFAADYCKAITYLKREHLEWIQDSSTALPFAHGEYGHAVDEHTVRSTLSMWKSLDGQIKRKGSPLSPAKYIVPTVIAMWNHIKGGVDVFSRVMSNSHPVHEKLHPLSAIWLRMLKALMYNAHQSQVISKAYSFLVDTQKCLSYRDYQRHRNHVGGSFKSFCIRLMSAPGFTDYLRSEFTANSLEGTVSTAVRTCDEDSADNDASSSSGRVIRYNKRSGYAEDQTLLNLRLSHKKTPHTQVKIPAPSSMQQQRYQLRCVLCCYLHEEDGSIKKTTKQTQHDGTHSRQGFKTTVMCKECSVALCQVSRFGDSVDTCFSLFHKERTLRDPCKLQSAQSRTAQQPANNDDREEHVSSFNSESSRVNSSRGGQQQQQERQQNEAQRNDGHRGPTLSPSRVAPVVIRQKRTNPSLRPPPPVRTGQEKKSGISTVFVDNNSSNRSNIRTAGGQIPSYSSSSSLARGGSNVDNNDENSNNIESGKQIRRRSVALKTEEARKSLRLRKIDSKTKKQRAATLLTKRTRRGEEPVGITSNHSSSPTPLPAHKRAKKAVQPVSSALSSSRPPSLRHRLPPPSALHQSSTEGGMFGNEGGEFRV